MNLTYDLSWNEIGFLDKIQLLARSHEEQMPNILYGNNLAKGAGYSSLSSTYYSIAGTAISHARNIFRKSKILVPLRLALWCFSWLPLGIWCYLRMLPLSNRAWDLLGDSVSAEQCDIRQSILLKRGHLEEARRCIGIGLWNKSHSIHTRSLLHLGLAEIELRTGEILSADEEVGMALIQIERIEKQDPQQAIRIYRKSAKIVSRLNGQTRFSTGELENKAEHLAYCTGTKDQLLKI